MYLPDWIQSYKEPRCEIRLIKGTYYKYEVSYQYNKEKKRTDKKTVRLLGKITQEAGFVPSDKDKIRRQCNQVPVVDIKTYGVFHLFEDLLKEEIASMRGIFGEEHADTLLSFAMMRWAYQSPIKRATRYHVHDFCSEHWSREHMSDKQISAALRYFGQNREKVVDWMRSLLKETGADADKFVMMDSTHASILSDKGFYSKENIQLLDEQELQYIIPLHRNNKLIDFTPLKQANYKREIKNYFSCQDRIIWYYTYEKEGKNLITFLDERLRVSEEADYLNRIKTHPENS
ncbi:hypothetical protein FACS1894176_11690 [Bacteroidia bacterium]|nr:hypothetical protein FACS1894176_11690 [Bacteroidia bacterium]